MTEHKDESQLPAPSGPETVAEQGEPQPVPEVDGYRVVGRLNARGSQGTIIEAFELAETARHVALKFPLGGALSSDRAMTLFENEVKTAASLEHANIARVYKCDRQHGVLYYSMEWIDGVNLDEYVTQSDLTQRQTLELMRTVCRAVQHAHQGGIIHRDLKPGNIMVVTGESADPEQIGQPKVLDFGLAVEESGGTLVTGLRGAGTPLYMAPEQAAGTARRPTTAMDVYALGVMLYKLLTGSHPHGFTREELGLLSSHQVRERIAREEVIRPRNVSKEIDKELETLLLKALAHEAELRYASAGDLAADIDNYLTGEPLTARPPSTLYFLKKRIKKYRVRVAVAAAVLVAMIGVAVFAYIRIAQERNRAESALKKSERENYFNLIALAETKIGELLEGQAEQLLLSAPRAHRNWEWGRLMYMCHPELLTLKGHSGLVMSAGFSPDGKRAVTASTDKTARIWDAWTGEELLTLRGHSGSVHSASFSPDGRRIVTAGGSDQTAKIWDAETGRELLTLGGHSGSVPSASFSPDGRRVVTAGYSMAKIWDAKTGRELLTLKEYRGPFASFSPDGRRVVTPGREQTAKIWDAETGRELLTLGGHSSSVGAACFSPDGRRVVTGSYDRTAKIWDAETGQELLTLRGHSGIVGSASFSSDGLHVVTGSTDHTAKIWDAQTGREILTLKGHRGYVVSAAFSPDGLRVVTADLTDKTAKIWDGQTALGPLTLKGHPNAVRSTAFSPDGQRIVTGGGSDKTAKIWDAETGRELLTLKGHSAGVLSAAFSPDGRRIVTGSYDHTAKIWDAETGRELLTLKGHSAGVHSASFSPSGRRVVTAGEQTAKIWDAQTGRELLTLKGHSHYFSSAVFSPDAQRVVTAGGPDNTAKIWDAQTGRELLTLRGHSNNVHSASFSPDGRRVVTPGDDRSAKIWDAETGRELLTLKGHSAGVLSATFSPDGRRIVTGSGRDDETAKIWDAQTGRELLTLKGHSGHVHWAAFSPDGLRVVTGNGDGTAKIWDALDWTLMTPEELAKEKAQRWRKRFAAKRRLGGSTPNPITRPTAGKDAPLPVR